MAKESGVMYRSFLDATRQLEPDKRLEAMDAYFDYVLDGVEYTGKDPVIRALMIVIKPTLDKAQNRYDAAVENGKKGGRPKNQTETRKKPEQNQTETSSKPEANLYVDVDVDVNDDVDVDVEDIPRAPAGASPLSHTLTQQIKEKVVEVGALTTLADSTWITPAQIKQLDNDIYVLSRQKMAAEYIRDRYGGFFMDAIRAVMPDFKGDIVYATG